MAIIKGNARQTTSVTRVGEGAEQYLRMLRDGSIVLADQRAAAVMEGRAFMANVGALSTPVAGGSTGLVVDIDRPSFLLSVPNGTSIRPLRIEVVVGLPVGAADDDEIDILIAVDQDKAWDSTGANTAVTIYNMNTLNAIASACTAKRTFTTNTTLPVNDLELAHYTKVFELYSTAASAGAHWTESKLLYEPAAPPVINGPAMLLVYWGGTVATVAFMCAQWEELPESSFA